MVCLLHSQNAAPRWRDMDKDWWEETAVRQKWEGRGHRGKPPSSWIVTIEKVTICTGEKAVNTGLDPLVGLFAIRLVQSLYQAVKTIPNTNNHTLNTNIVNTECKMWCWANCNYLQFLTVKIEWVCTITKAPSVYLFKKNKIWTYPVHTGSIKQ